MIGLAALLLWFLVLRAPVIDYAPGWLRGRMPTPHRPAQRPTPGGRAAGVLLVVCALLAGTATHLAWDSFTHDGPLVAAFPALAGPLGPWELHRWLHGLSTVVGLGLLVWWTRRWVARTPLRLAPTRVSGRERVLVWVGLATLAAVVAVAALVYALATADPDRFFTTATISIGVTGAAALVIAAAWHARF